MEKSTHTAEYRVLVELLREVRKSAGMTQVELAEKLGQTQSFISKCEKGDLRLDVVQLARICEALGLSLSTFVRRYERRIQSEG